MNDFEKFEEKTSGRRKILSVEDRASETIDRFIAAGNIEGLRKWLKDVKNGVQFAGLNSKQRKNVIAKVEASIRASTPENTPHTAKDKISDMVSDLNFDDQMSGKTKSLDRDNPKQGKIEPKDKSTAWVNVLDKFIKNNAANIDVVEKAVRAQPDRYGSGEVLQEIQDIRDANTMTQLRAAQAKLGRVGIPINIDKFREHILANPSKTAQVFRARARNAKTVEDIERIEKDLAREGLEASTVERIRDTISVQKSRIGTTSEADSVPAGKVTVSRPRNFVEPDPVKDQNAPKVVVAEGGRFEEYRQSIFEASKKSEIDDIKRIIETDASLSDDQKSNLYEKITSASRKVSDDTPPPIPARPAKPVQDDDTPPPIPAKPVFKPVQPVQEEKQQPPPLQPRNRPEQKGEQEIRVQQITDVGDPSSQTLATSNIPVVSKAAIAPLTRDEILERDYSEFMLYENGKAGFQTIDNELYLQNLLNDSLRYNHNKVYESLGLKDKNWMMNSLGEEISYDPVFGDFKAPKQEELTYTFAAAGPPRFENDNYPRSLAQIFA